jgi:alkylation response protein AidB-like acyl-CoA dehydrogenase
VRIGGARAIPNPAPAPTSPSLRTKAERFTGDDGKEYYIVNGQKTWTTMASTPTGAFSSSAPTPTSRRRKASASC